VVIIPHNATIKYMGLHEYIPGVSSPLIADSIIIGESSWKEFVGAEQVNNHNSTNWIYRVSDVDGDALKALGSRLEADSRVANVLDWTTEHEAVERNGGLIFGTPGLLSLQFVVASIAAVASSFVFLSLVLNQRKKELAVLQAIGASPTQMFKTTFKSGGLLFPSRRQEAGYRQHAQNPLGRPPKGGCDRGRQPYQGNENR
jgi:ABC-type antimicrobial peptide transport system permease subunit